MPKKQTRGHVSGQEAKGAIAKIIEEHRSLFEAWQVSWLTEQNSRLMASQAFQETRGAGRLSRSQRAK